MGSIAASAPTRAEYPVTTFDTSNRPAATTVAARSAKPYAIGKASSYGKDCDGKPTASGERYDMYELTTAQRTLPFASWGKATNLSNRRWILVRINDRGP